MGEGGKRARYGALLSALSVVALALLGLLTNLLTSAVPQQNPWVIGGLAVAVALVAVGVAVASHRASASESQPGSGDSSKARPTPAVIGELPPKLPVEQPRTELLDLKSMVAEGDPASVVCVIGLPGTGKTELAAELARYCHDHLRWSLVAWVSAATVDVLVPDLARVADSIKVAYASGDDYDSARRLREHLRIRTEPALLILDNAQDANEISRWLPGTGLTRIVITSTNSSMAGLGRTLELGSFTRKESIAYLRKRTSVPSFSAANSLAGDLGDLPLALAQAASAIRQRHYDYEQYRQMLTDYDLRKSLVRRDGERYAQGTAEAILLSIQSIESADDRHSTASKCLDQIAVLAPVGVQRDLVRVLMTSSRVLSKSSEPDVDAVETAIDRIVQGSLLGWVNSDEPILLMHRLVSRVLRDRARNEGSLAGILTRTVGDLDAQIVIPDDRWKPVRYDLVDHVSTLWRHNCDEYSRSIVERSTLSSALLLATRAINYLGATANVGLAMQLADTWHADAVRLLGEEDVDTLTAAYYRAYAYDCAQRYDEAIAIYEATLAAQLRSLEPNDHRVLDTVHLLTYARGVNTKDTTTAEREMAELIKSFESVHGKSHKKTLGVRAGHAMFRGAEDPDGAADELEVLLADQTTALGADHLYTLNTRAQLAAWRGPRDRAAAVRTFEALVNDYRRYHGAENPYTLLHRGWLATLRGKAGDVAGAVAELTEVLGDQERILGPDHPHTCNTRAEVKAWQDELARLS